MDKSPKAGLRHPKRSGRKRKLPWKILVTCLVFTLATWWFTSPPIPPRPVPPAEKTPTETKAQEFLTALGKELLQADDHIDTAYREKNRWYPAMNGVHNHFPIWPGQPKDMLLSNEEDILPHTSKQCTNPQCDWSYTTTGVAGSKLPYGYISTQVNVVDRVHGATNMESRQKVNALEGLQGAHGIEQRFGRIYPFVQDVTCPECGFPLKEEILLDGARYLLPGPVNGRLGHEDRFATVPNDFTIMAFILPYLSYKNQIIQLRRYEISVSDLFMVNPVTGAPNPLYYRGELESRNWIFGEGQWPTTGNTGILPPWTELLDFDGDGNLGFADDPAADAEAFWIDEDMATYWKILSETDSNDSWGEILIQIELSTGYTLVRYEFQGAGVPFFSRYCGFIRPKDQFQIVLNEIHGLDISTFWSTPWWFQAGDPDAISDQASRLFQKDDSIRVDALRNLGEIADELTLTESRNGAGSAHARGDHVKGAARFTNRVQVSWRSLFSDKNPGIVEAASSAARRIQTRMNQRVGLRNQGELRLTIAIPAGVEDVEYNSKRPVVETRFFRPTH